MSRRIASYLSLLDLAFDWVDKTCVSLVCGINREVPTETFSLYPFDKSREFINTSR